MTCCLGAELMEGEGAQAGGKAARQLVSPLGVGLDNHCPPLFFKPSAAQAGCTGQLSRKGSSPTEETQEKDWDDSPERVARLSAAVLRNHSLARKVALALKHGR